MLNLDDLLGTRHEDATFHDSELESVCLDFLTNSIRMDFRIPFGLSPDRTLLYKSGTLTFEDILYYAVEPVRYQCQANNTPSLWITSDGPLPDPNVPIPASELEGLPDDAFAHYFYSSTTNSFIALGAMKASFAWL